MMDYVCFMYLFSYMLALFTVSKDEWDTKEAKDTGKSMKNALQVLW